MPQANFDRRGVHRVPDDGAWPLPVEADLHPVFSRLMDLGTAWATRRGDDWRVVLNHGRRPFGGPFHRFRWQVVTEAVRFAAGRAPAPPVDYGALPVGLRELLAWAVPAALVDPPSDEPDLARSCAAALEADQLATELAVSGAPDGADRSAYGRAGPGPESRQASTSGRAIAMPAVGVAPSDAMSVPTTTSQEDGATRLPSAHDTWGTVDAFAVAPEPGSPLADPADLLAAALVSPVPIDLPTGAGEVLARLRAAPLPLAELRRIAAGHGLLPGTLLDALDAAAVRATGSPATRVEDHVVHLHANYAAALARGEDPLA